MSDGYVRFIITGDARTGSTMLAQALNTNPAVRSLREIFHHWKDFLDYGVEGYDPFDTEALRLRNDDPVRFLRERIFCGYPEQIGAVGFKYIYGQMWGYDDLTDFLKNDAELHVIHLKRRNWLRALVSVRIAELSSRWLDDESATPRRKRRLHVRAASALLHPRRALGDLRRRIAPPPPAPKPRLTLTPEECEQWFKRTQWEVGRVDELFARQPRLDVFFEDMLADRAGAFSAVQRFLEVEPVDLAVTSRRQNPEPLSELLTNHDDLRATFTGTDFVSFFDE